MAKGIYERKGKKHKDKLQDVTYYIRYQVTYIDSEGYGHIKDQKEKVGRRSRGFTRELAKEALKARLGEIAQARFNLDKVKNRIPFLSLWSAITSFLPATSPPITVRSTQLTTSGTISKADICLT